MQLTPSDLPESDLPFEQDLHPGISQGRDRHRNSRYLRGRRKLLASLYDRQDESERSLFDVARWRRGQLERRK